MTGSEKEGFFCKNVPSPPVVIKMAVLWLPPAALILLFVSTQGDDNICRRRCRICGQKVFPARFFPSPELLLLFPDNFLPVCGRIFFREKKYLRERARSQAA